MLHSRATSSPPDGSAPLDQIPATVVPLEEQQPVRHAFLVDSRSLGEGPSPHTMEAHSRSAIHSFQPSLWTLDSAPTRPALQRRGSADLFLEAAAQVEERDRSMNSNSAGIAVQPTPDLPSLPQLSEMEETPFYSLSSSSSHCEEDEEQDEDADKPAEHKSTLKRSHITKGKPLPHVYRDFSVMPDAAGFVRKKTGGVSQPFPEKLYEMLEAESQRPAPSNIVSWLPHGRAFIVHKPKLFTQDIMPLFFRQSKLTSFQRQLNLYGFRRITQGQDAGAYYHELFLRGRPQLCMRMMRQKVKGTGHKQPTDVDSEPNFYIMPPIIPGNESTLHIEEALSEANLGFSDASSKSILEDHYLNLPAIESNYTGYGTIPPMHSFHSKTISPRSKSKKTNRSLHPQDELEHPNYNTTPDPYSLMSPLSPSFAAANLLTGLASASRRNSLAFSLDTINNIPVNSEEDRTTSNASYNVARRDSLPRYVWNGVQAEEL